VLGGKAADVRRKGFLNMDFSYFQDEVTEKTYWEDMGIGEENWRGKLELCVHKFMKRL
jgi:hypothetical protein